MRFALKAACLSVAILALLSALAAAETPKSVEEVLDSIIAKQDAASISRIDCGKISESDFEELGDAVMERMAGSSELHERMDAMMGGEGSESLKQMHIIMGENWLGCGSSAGFGGMMGGGMMGFGLGYGGMMPIMMRMMGNYYPAYYAGYDSILVFGAAGWILFISLLIFMFAHLSQEKRGIIKKK